MRLVDVSALYSPNGGGIRTYTHRKLALAEQSGLDLTVVVPGLDDAEQRFGSARLVSIKSPRFPLDRNYCYFDSDAVIHAALDRLQPDMIECSSPWGSAAAVAAWPGPAPRALIMHADPMSAWAYRYLDRLLSRQTIDRGFGWFWRHLKACDERFDMVVAASPSLAARLAQHGLRRVETIPMGVDPGIFSPALRDADLRARLLAMCSLPPQATLLIGVGRHGPEKQWPMVIAGVTAASYGRAIGLVLLGDGHGRAAVQRAVGDNPHVTLLAPVSDRSEFARLLASADALVHGAGVETFGLACAEARASGLPLIVPDEGGAFDQLADGAGIAYRAGDAASLAQNLANWLPQLAADRRTAVALAGQVPTLDQHFATLHARYRALQQMRRPQAA
ncbi:glycosyltransferase [Sandarakinorhabdus oryzae]|uniref:glycosyltransferase n=1 Tax=Sandarakinorhabdus oryzae TaxID=2675220 RepID=UPI0012E0F988|nr:glycosyltransferase [Sandarakinorhabdus oryzae]